MHLSTIVLVFISFWLSALGLVGVGMLVAGVLKLGDNPNVPWFLIALVPIGIFVIAITFTVLAFKNESNKSKLFLAELLEGAEI